MDRKAFALFNLTLGEMAVVKKIVAHNVPKSPEYPDGIFLKMDLTSIKIGWLPAPAHRYNLIDFSAVPPCEERKPDEEIHSPPDAVA